MNKKQRSRNRNTAQKLESVNRVKRNSSHVCENCGEKGGHWVQTRGQSLESILAGTDDQDGFWTCPKLYGVDGRRLPEHTEQRFLSNGEPSTLLAALIFRQHTSNKNG